MMSNANMMQRRCQSRLVPWLLGIVLIAPTALVGCGDEGPPRLAVSGSVTLDGKPLPEGSIVFAPLDGATAAVAEVKDGTYQIASGSGLASGRYQVEVRAEAPTGKRIAHPDFPEETIDEVRQLIPPRYNARTELAAEVKPDKENAFDFTLSSRDVKKRARR